MKYPQIPNSTIIRFPNEHEVKSHHSELNKLNHSKMKTWIQLDSEMIQTRFRLQLLILNFKSTEEPASIQAKLINTYSNINQVKTDNKINNFYLVALPQTDAPFYDITDYIGQCIDGDLSVAERLRGRTVLYIYQTEREFDDLLNVAGVNDFIVRYLANYLGRYGTEHIIGFVVDIPPFLSIFDGNGSSVPWTHSILEYLSSDNPLFRGKSETKTDASFLPFLLYETYDSPIIRSFFWQKLTLIFSQCFLNGLKDFCNQHKIRFAVKVRESARSLQYDLGTLLEHTDIPILSTVEGDTSRRFVVAKYVCSNHSQAGIMRQVGHTFTDCVKDSGLGFNHWVSGQSASLHTENIQNGSLAQLLQEGSPRRNILMLSPTQSLWMRPIEKEWNSIIRDWGWLCNTVWNLGYDFDVVSENQFADTRVDKKNACIRFNGQNYHLVLLPSSISLHETSVQLLTDYTKGKGRIIANAPVPYLLNGRIGLEPYKLERLVYMRQTTILNGPENERMRDLKKYLNNWVPQNISVFSKETNQRADGILIHQRYKENTDIFFMLNTEFRTNEVLIENIGEYKNVRELHLQSGKEIPIECWQANENTYMNCKFESGQGRLFIIS